MAAEFDRWSAEKAAHAERLRAKYPDFAEILDAQAAEDAVHARMARAAGMPESLSAQESAQPPTAARITAAEPITPPTPQTERERILAMPDLYERTCALLSLVREPTREEREVLERKLGYVVLSTLQRSLKTAVSADRRYFWNAQMGYLNKRPTLRDYTPPAPLIVAIRNDPEQMYISGSFNMSHERLLEMAEEHSQSDIEPELKDAKAIIIPAITLVDLDRGWGQRPQTAGQKLFRYNFARALDRYEIAGGVDAAGVGRGGPTAPLRVGGWGRGRGGPDTGGLSAVVFLGNEAKLLSNGNK